MQERFELYRKRRKELVAIFRKLDAPTVAEMNGEFRASLLDQGRWLHNFLTIVAFNTPGIWISKSFRPTSDDQGQGYNSFRIGGDIRRIYRMSTYVGPSQLDGRPSYHLDYRPLNKRNVPSVSNLAGEVRRLDSTTFLGVGTTDFGMSRLRRAQPFMLEGPVAEFVPIPNAA